MTNYEEYLLLEEDLKRQGFGVVVDYVKELHADSRSLRQEVERLQSAIESGGYSESYDNECNHDFSVGERYE